MIKDNRKFKLIIFLNIAIILMTCFKVLDQAVFNSLIMFINGSYLVANVGQKIIK